MLLTNNMVTKTINLTINLLERLSKRTILISRPYKQVMRTITKSRIHRNNLLFTRHNLRLFKSSRSNRRPKLNKREKHELN